MSSTMITMAAVRQHRRATASSRKKYCYESMTRITKEQRLSTGSYDLTRRISWLDKMRKRSGVSAPKGKVVMEARFSPDLRGLYNVRFSPCGTRLITAFGAGAILMWCIEEEDKPCITIRSAPKRGAPIMSLRFLKKDTEMHYFAVGACGTVFLCGIESDNVQEFAKEPENEINAADVNNQQNCLVTAGKDAILRIYDVETAKLKTKICKSETSTSGEDLTKYHKMRVFAVKFHPEQDQVFLSGGWDDCVKIWDLRSKELLMREIRGPHICGEALDVKETMVLTGSWTVDNSLQLWDYSSGKLIEVIEPMNRPRTIDGEFLYCCQFYVGDPVCNTVVSGGSGLGRVEVVDINDRRVVSSFKVHKSVQALDSCENYLVFGGMESTFKLATL